VDQSGFDTAVVHTYTGSAAVEVAHTYTGSAAEVVHTDTCASAVSEVLADQSGFDTAVVHIYTGSAAVEVAHTYAGSAVEVVHTDTCASAVLVVSAQIPLVDGLALATGALLPSVAAAHIPFAERLAGAGADAPQARGKLLPLSEAVAAAVLSAKLSYALSAVVWARLRAAVQAYSLLLSELPWSQRSRVAAVGRAQAWAPLRAEG
jgi:hypothetical protein